MRCLIFRPRLKLKIGMPASLLEEQAKFDYSHRKTDLKCLFFIFFIFFIFLYNLIFISISHKKDYLQNITLQVTYTAYN